MAAEAMALSSASPADGYGDEGAPGGSVPGGATLVFVVDILAAD
jgi:FKBP-type peptidyl-prolyl cis-trans isomerase